MSEQIAISIDRAATPIVQEIVRATVATLPQSFRLVSDDAAVIAIDGRSDWGVRVEEAIARGVSGTIVIDPTSISDVTAGRLLGSPVPMVLDAPWRHGSLVDAMAPVFQSLSHSGSMLEARATVTSTSQLRSAVIALAFTAQALLGTEVLDVEEVVTTPGTVIAFSSPLGGPLLRLSADVGPGPAWGAWFRLVGADRIATLRLPAPDIADTGVA